MSVLAGVFLSKKGSNPLIISPGYKITEEESLTLTKACLRGYRIPEPTRLAHNLVNQFRRGELDQSNVAVVHPSMNT